MDIVKRTDPSTVTQHGLYMRPLTDPSLHPLVAKAPLAEAPVTPPKEEERKPASEPAPVQHPIQRVKTYGQTGAQGVATAAGDAMPVLQKDTQNLKLGTSNPKSSPETAPTLHAKTAEKPADNGSGAVLSNPKSTVSSAEMNGTSLPMGVPTPVGESSELKGNSTGLMGSASVPMGNLAPVGVPSATNGSPRASDVAPQTDVGKTAVPGSGQESPDDEDVCWGRGRVSLLGDAAHATIPNGMLLLYPVI